MNLASAEDVLVVLLLALSVTRGQNNWAVIYPTPQLCASEGSTVELSSSYTYPQEEGGLALSVVERLWFISQENQQPVDLRTLSQFAGRVKYSCQHETCSLRIRELRRSDAALYRFRFLTNKESGRFTGEPGVNLTVTGLWVKKGHSYSYPGFSCESRCTLTGPVSYTWYKNGEAVGGQSSQRLSSGVSYSDSVSCAVTGPEALPSPPCCAYSYCIATYNQRNICAFQGSSVDFSCSNEAWSQNTYVSWFRSGQDRVYSKFDRFQLDHARKRSTLRIIDLEKSDSAEYHCRPSYSYCVHRRFLGTTLKVTDPDLQVQVFPSPTGPKLLCHSSCLQDRFPFVWYGNGREIPGETSASYSPTMAEGSYSCGVLQHRSHPVYAPTDASVTVSPPGGGVQNSLVSLTCGAAANPAAKYAWFRGNQSQPVSEEQQLLFPSLQASDCGEYYCTAQNQLGLKTSQRVSVKLLYPPKFCSVSVSPSEEVQEHTSVTLSCSSDANPAANYSWFQGNRTLVQEQEGLYHLSSIRLEDGGIYLCRSENHYGETSCSVSMDVQYPPRSCSVSVSPSAEVEEDTSVTLSCSSDANPAANYSWFKEGEESPRSSEQNFTISGVRAEDSGHYSCHVQNTRGRLTSSLRLTVAPDVNKLVIVGLVSVAFVLFLSLALFLCNRRTRKFVKEGTKCREPEQTRAQSGQEKTSAAAQELDQDQDGELHYASVHLRLVQNDVLYSNITPAHAYRQTVEDEDEETEYSNVVTAASPRHQEDGDDLSGLYSVLRKDLMNSS